MSAKNGVSGWAEREARRIGKARTLLHPACAGLRPAYAGLRPAVEGAGGDWADLGCGDGIFTSALHTLLQPGSQLYAVDRDRRALEALVRNFAQSYPEAALHPLLADFTRPLSLPPLDGLVMANSLHFVSQKRPVLARIVSLLKPGGRLIVVEYNAVQGNYAVPYPLDEAGFLVLARDLGLRQVCIVTKIPSSFLGEVYAGTGLAASDV